MIALTLALALTQNQGSNAAEVVSKMLAHYNAAQTMTGTILMTQSAMGKSVRTETVLQFEKPDKLYIKQISRSSQPRQWLVTCDGQYVAYDTPNDIRDTNEERLVEPLVSNGVKQKFTDIYRAVVRSLGDRSAPLDIAINRLEDLKFLRGQWKTVEWAGEEEVNGEKLQSVRGLWREYPDAPTHSGTFQMWITPSGDLRRYAIIELVKFPLGPGQLSDPQEVITTWDARLVVDGKPDPALFKLVR